MEIPAEPRDHKIPEAGVRAAVELVAMSKSIGPPHADGPVGLLF